MRKGQVDSDFRRIDKYATCAPKNKFPRTFYNLCSYNNLHTPSTTKILPAARIPANLTEKTALPTAPYQENTEGRRA